jgi:transcriptional repressor NF-X1
MYRDNQKFCQTYEREFRVFAADQDEKRLRFKPMAANQRAFIHSLAEDFGLDSESQDPEPHRHVVVFKTPKFVSAPMKTLAQCFRTKPAVVSEAPASKGLVSSGEPFNAFLLSNPRFGLTIDELYADLLPEFSAADMDLDISFLPSGDIIVKSRPSRSWVKMTDNFLINMKPNVAKKIKLKDLASSATLCAVDSSLNVVRREDDHAGGGWSTVAKGASASRTVPQASVGTKSAFTVLGSKSVLRKKRETSVEAVDDWEKEAEALDAV